jgi:RHS repeat-associated protein
MALVLALSYAVVVASDRDAGAVDLPPGDIMASEPNFGWTKGDFSVSGDGAARYSLPLWLPKGRGGVAPALALSYSSQAGNGPLGVGWSLSGLPSITQCPRTRAQHGFTEKLLFDGGGTWCLGGNRLVPVGGLTLPDREYRTEHETYAKVVGHGLDDGVPDYFTIWDRDGAILTLGQAGPRARETAYRLELRDGRTQPDSPIRVTLAWAVNLIEDRNGNAATIEYDHTEANEEGLWSVEMRPSVIRYNPNRRVEFTWEPRPDPVDGFAAGVHTRTGHRLARVAMFGGPLGGTAEKLREYQLTYRNTSITGRSLLTEIKECDGPGICKQGLRLEYSPGSNDFNRIEFPDITDVGTSILSGNRVLVIDINGDGRDDLLYPDATNNWKIRHSQGEQFGPAVAAGIPRIAAQTQAQIRVVDFDSDGRTDAMAEVPDASVGGTGWKLYRSNGATFEAYPQNIGFFGTADDELDPIYFGDLDGNGTQDLLTARFEDADDSGGDRLITGRWRYRLNDGSEEGGRFGPEVETQSTLAAAPASRDQNNVVDTDGDGRVELTGLAHDPGGPNHRKPRSLGLDYAGRVEMTPTQVHVKDEANLGDFNGDGLLDELITRQRLGGEDHEWEISASISTGNGTVASDRLDLVRPSPNAIRVADFDSDGRQDVLIIGTGGYTWADGGFRRFGLPQLGAASAATQPLDVDGDGAMDIVDVEDGHLRIFRRLGGQPDQVTMFGSLGAGPAVEVTYSTLADRDVHTPGTCGYPQICLRRGQSVVKRHRVAMYVAIGENHWDAVTHTYAGARADLLGRGWLGFERHTTTRAGTGEVSTSLFDNVTRDASLNQYPFAHIVKSGTTTVADRPGGTELRIEVTNDDVLRRLGTGRYAVQRRSSSTTEAERPPGSTWRTLRSRTSQFTYDAFGNADRVVQTTAGGRSLTQDPTFRNDTTAWLIGLPTREVSRGCDAANVCTTRTSTSDYDDKGNLTVSVVEPGSPQFELTTRMQYGQFGVVQSITRTDSAGPPRVERFEYGADMLHPTATVNVLGHRSQMQTHSGLGVSLRTVDPNGVPTTMRYDGFGRRRETYRADGSFERIDHRSGFRQMTTVSTSGGGSTTVVVDPLGREVERRVKAFDGRIATSVTEYDVLGRVARTSRPAFSGETRQFTTMEYDNRDRPLSTTAPDGVRVRHRYSGLETNTYDGKGIRSYVVANVDGDVAASFEDDPNSTVSLATRFAYGPFGETTKITAPDDSVQTMHHDRLGRLDRIVDPSQGTTTTSYNAFGEMTKQTDGSGRTTTYARDLLGRVTSTTSPDGTATNTWDTAAKGLGQLASARSEDGVTIGYTYDPIGRLATTSYVVDGTAYEFGHGYDQIGRQVSTTYPAIPGAPATAGRLTVNYEYNQHGYLYQIRDAAPGGPAYWTAQERNAAGQLTRERFHNGVVTTRGYASATGLPTAVAATGPGDVGRIADMSFEYDANRNVTLRQDRTRARVENFGYDNLNRLVTWRLTSGGQTTYAYDKAGNLKTETVPGHPDRNVTYAYGEDGAPPHALTTRNGETYRYDGAGRQISGPQRTIDYNRAGLPTTIRWGQGKTTGFDYDPAGARAVKRDSDGNTVVHAGELFELRSPAGTGGNEIHNLHNIVAEGRVVAQINRVQRTGGGPITDTRVFYLTGDHQDSTVRLSDKAGAPVGDGDEFLGKLFYDPFGRRIDADGTPLGTQTRGGPRQGYTGHYHDDEYGLINMKGRWYDPAARRFLTPDPLIADPMASQSLNRYSYVQNNPLTFTDPTGLLITITDDGNLHGAGPSRLGRAWLQTSSNLSLLGAPGPGSAPLTTHAPDMANTLSLGGGPGADDDTAATRKEKLDNAFDLAGTLVDAIGLLGGSKGPLAGVYTFADTLLDALGVEQAEESGDPFEDVISALSALGALAEGWIAWNTMVNVGARGMSLAAAAATAAAEYAGVALLAGVSEIVGVVIGTLQLMAWSTGMTKTQVATELLFVIPHEERQWQIEQVDRWVTEIRDHVELDLPSVDIDLQVPSMSTDVIQQLVDPKDRGELDNLPPGVRPSMQLPTDEEFQRRRFP